MTWERDWCIAPGATLDEWRQEQGLTKRQAADACGLTRTRFLRLLDGRARLTARIAEQLEAGTGISRQLWLNLERDYRAGLAAGKMDTTKGSS